MATEMAGLACNFESITLKESKYSKEEEVNELKNRKTTVKELFDTGISKLPNVFIHPKEVWQSDTPETYNRDLQVPVIDLQGIQSEQRSKIVSEIYAAPKTWGLFHVINHGVAKETIHAMLESVREFNEQPKELRSEFYSQDVTKKMRYHLSINPVSNDPVWKDTMSCHYEDQRGEESEALLPPGCRKPMSDYVNSVTELKDTLSELLSEALGLKSDYLKSIGCVEARKLVCHYSPACPEPDLTLATSKHSDPFFLTCLVQNNISGLQALYENQWVDVIPEEGAILVLIGDLLQLITNDIFKSAFHRVLASSTGPRLSSATFFIPSTKNRFRVYGPIKEILEENTAPVYKETSHAEYIKTFPRKGPCGLKTLSKFWV